MDGTSSVRALFRHSKINLHWLDSPELGLQNDATFVGCDVVWCQMTSFDPPPWIRHLGFYFFPEKSRNNGNWYKIKPEWGKLEKNTELCQKKSIFGQTYMKLAVAMETSKMMDTQLTYQNICEGWMNSYWKFQPLRVIRLFKILKKPWITRFNKIINKFNWVKVSQSFYYIE